MKNASEHRPEIRPYLFDLPDELIARYPASPRTAARLMVVRTGQSLRGDIAPENLQIEWHQIADLPDILQKNDLLVLNHSAVSFRRIYLQRSSGAQMEALFLESLPDQPAHWICLLRGKRKLKSGEILTLQIKQVESPEKMPPQICFEFQEASLTQARALLIARPGPGLSELAWSCPADAENFFKTSGEPPLPPYLGRRAEPGDRDSYQTTFAREPGSVAAPTAGLHFNSELFERLQVQGIQYTSLQLHVGYGTFAPLQTENFEKGRLHKEGYFISDDCAKILNTARSQPESTRGRLIAVGTTSLRALEDNIRKTQAHTIRQIADAGRFQAGSGSTELFLKPPDQITAIDGLLTNFHLPGSSLLMLVACLIGRDTLMHIYALAIRKRMRFFSYGDAILILP